MKEVAPFVVGLAVFFVIMSIGIFITWEPNFAKWDSGDRFLVAAISITFGIGAGGLYSSNNKKD